MKKKQAKLLRPSLSTNAFPNQFDFYRKPFKPTQKIKKILINIEILSPI
jgi:hypothetical protein